MAAIWVLRLGFGPEGWHLCLKDMIWASRLVFGLQGWCLGLEFETGKGGEGEGEISPYEEAWGLGPLPKKREPDKETLILGNSQ